MILSIPEAGSEAMKRLEHVFVARQQLMPRRLTKRQRETLLKLLSATLQDTARRAENL